ncbi:MAG: hypothetical protein ACHQM4_08765 [Thermoanaerobaculia bacterium]
MTKKAAALALAVCLAAARASHAAGPVDAQTAYTTAKAAAAKWQPDAQLLELQSSGLASLDAEGRSAEWVLKWASKSAGKINLVSVRNGAVTTYEMDSRGGHAIVLSPQSILDSKKLVAMADAKGGAARRAEGVKVSLGLVQSSVIDAPLWHVSYKKDNKEVFHVGIEANGGKTKVLSE